MLLTGPAGSGKTQVLNALHQFFHEVFGDRCLRIMSYMGIAANNVSGMTLHSALNLSTANNAQRSRPGNSDEELTYMWSGVDYLFIDEISMISCEFLETISSTLCRVTGRTEPFGRISVIFAGDLTQLPPVGEPRLYAYINPSYGASCHHTQKKLKGKLLWLSVLTVIVLHKINRQSGASNHRFVELLSRLRIGECNTSDYQLLRSRIISESQNLHTWGLDVNDYSPVIISDNVSKDAINHEMAVLFASKTNQLLLSYMAEDTKNGSAITDHAVLQIISLLHSGKTHGQLHQLPLVIGMPVMITMNLDVQGGIVNGSIGTVRSICFKTLTNGEHALSHCIVHLPNATAPVLPNLGVNEYPIMQESMYITYKGGKRNSHGFSFKRMQLPLIPAFAMTAHKSQGQTLPKAIIDLNSCCGSEAPYVMVSHVHHLDDLLILRPFEFHKIRYHLSQDLRKELDRLTYHHHSTVLQYGDESEPPRLLSPSRN
jgi:ATP-dependent exoDNAse (exonuclease V) alpha subunit